MLNAMFDAVFFAYYFLLRKIFTERSWMAKVPNGVETLPKISIA